MNEIKPEKISTIPVPTITCKPVIPGVGKDAPVVTLECGVQQSAIPARMELIDPLAIIDLGKVLMEGAAKYGESKRGEGWYKIPTRNHLNKALIHIYAYLAGDTSDDHLGHAQCRVHMALATHLGDEDSPKFKHCGRSQKDGTSN